MGRNPKRKMKLLKSIGALAWVGSHSTDYVGQQARHSISPFVH